MITSRTNPLISKARSLRRTKSRTESGLFLIEGLRQIGEAIAVGWEIETLLYAPEQLISPFGHHLVATFDGRKEEVSSEVLLSVAEKQHPQGIIAVARQSHKSLSSVYPTSFGAAVVSPQDPGNVGTILRTLDAVGGTMLYLLDGGVDHFHPAAVRAAMGASFVIPVVEATFDSFAAWRRAHAIHLIGTSARAGADFRQARPNAPWILLFGSEQKGLSEDQKAACDLLVTLPMRGRVSSLNLAVAASILLFAYSISD